MTNYNKWESLWISSDDDIDCHPNIDKYAWRRLKKKIRIDKGENKKEIQLFDKWSLTTLNESTKKAKEQKINPKNYLEENKVLIDKFVGLETKVEADEFIKVNPTIVNSFTEGYLITEAVDIAVSNQQDKKIYQYAERCLQIHNIITSANAANMAPQISVPLFYKQLNCKKKRDLYEIEFRKQIEEIIGRIEVRRLERINFKKEAIIKHNGIDYQKAPLGPGGLDPTKVLQELPKDLSAAFCSHDKKQLVKAFKKIPKNEAAKWLQKCIDSGLWNVHVNEKQ